MTADVAMIPQEDLDDPALREADAEAVMEQFVSGKKLDPTIAARVLERSAQATEATRRKFGTINIAVDLLREIREET